MGEAADLAVLARRLLEVIEGQGVRLGRAGAEAGLLQQVLADQVGHLAAHAAHAQVDAGLAEVDGQQLRMAVGHVQEGHRPRALEGGRQVVEVGGRAGRGLARQGQAGGGGKAQQADEIAFGQIHGSGLTPWRGERKKKGPGRAPNHEEKGGGGFCRGPRPPTAGRPAAGLTGSPATSDPAAAPSRA